MEGIEIINEFDNRVMKRKEYVLKIDYGGGATPSKGDLQLLIAKKMAVEPEKVEIVKILSEKGYPAGKVWVKIWDEPKVEVIKKPEENKGEGENNGEETTEQVEA